MYINLHAYTQPTCLLPMKPRRGLQTLFSHLQMIIAQHVGDGNGTLFSLPEQQLFLPAKLFLQCLYNPMLLMGNSNIREFQVHPFCHFWPVSNLFYSPLDHKNTALNTDTESRTWKVKAIIASSLLLSCISSFTMQMHLHS